MEVSGNVSLHNVWINANGGGSIMMLGGQEHTRIEGCIFLTGRAVAAAPPRPLLTASGHDVIADRGWGGGLAWRPRA
jgi:hypothetical protein